MNDPKQIIVMRKDLNMRRGKQIAQGAHASMKVLLDIMERGEGFLAPDWKIKHMILNIDSDSALDRWINGKFTKICVSVDSEQELLELYNKAKEMNIPCALITDAGLTEFNGIPTNTCIAIGPDFPEKIDPITSHLKLL